MFELKARPHDMVTSNVLRRPVPSTSQSDAVPKNRRVIVGSSSGTLGSVTRIGLAPRAACPANGPPESWKKPCLVGSEDLWSGLPVRRTPRARLARLTHITWKWKSPRCIKESRLPRDHFHPFSTSMLVSQSVFLVEERRCQP